MKATIIVLPKPNVLDPQGVAIAQAARHLGLAETARIRAGKFFEITLDPSDASPEDLQARLHTIARDLLSNPVIEDYRILALED